MNSKWFDKLQVGMNKFNSNKYIKALMEGMILILPLTITGAFCTLIKVLPIAPYQTFLTSHGIDKILDLPLTFTSNMMGLLISFTIAYTLAGFFKESQVSAGLVSLVSFLILSPIETSTNEYGQVLNKLPFDFMGAQGMFTAIITAFIFGRLFIWISQKGWTIKMPESIPTYISKSFASIVPGFLVIIIVTIVSGLISITPFGTIHNVIYGSLQLPLQNIGANVWSVVLISIIGQLLWFFGIHGSMVTLGIVAPVWSALDLANIAAYSAGQELPNITGMAFWTVYTAGDLIALAFMLAFLAKSSQYKTLGKLAFPPSIFTIGEPIAYGVPLVMNFVYVIPYIFVNAIILFMAYFLTKLGVLPILNGISAPTGTPIIISGFISGGWKVALFQVFALILRFAAWMPFFKMGDRQLVAEEAQNTEVK